MAEDRPTLLVAAIIVNKDGHVLITRHGPKWHLPDGDVRHGETLREALARSLFTDLGVRVSIETSPVRVTETVSGRHYVTLHYHAAITEGAPGNCDPNFKWGYASPYLLHAFDLKKFHLSTLEVLRSCLLWKLEEGWT